MMRSVRCPNCRQYTDLPCAIPREATEVVVSCSCGGELSVPICPKCKGLDFVGDESCQCHNGQNIKVLFREPEHLRDRGGRFAGRPEFGQKPSLPSRKKLG